MSSSNNRQQQGKYPLRDIVTPHEHDVLSGRGNFVNYHAGNEHFRALVRKHKVAYVACPKPQKGKFSRLIVEEVRSRNPPGRFLKQDPNTKLWHDIGEKKALDKTRQALREGAPEISKELGGDGEETGIVVGGSMGAMPNSVLQGPGSAGIYGLNDGGMGGYGAPDLKNELDDPPLVSQQAALSNMMQQQQHQRMQVPQQQQQQHLSRQMMQPPLTTQQPTHPGQLYAGQIQRMQQQQQQQRQQQQLRLQQQSLSKNLIPGGQLGGLGGLGGMGGMGGGLGGGVGMVGGMGVNPYANFQNDYDDLEPTPLDGGGGGASMNNRYQNQYGQMSSANQSQFQAQLQAQAQLQVQAQQLQQMQRQQQQQQQQQSQLHQNHGRRSLASHLAGGGVGSSQLSKDDSSNNSNNNNRNKRPVYGRENSEQSLQLGHAFEDTVEHGLLDGTGGTDKNKQKMGGSSNHLSLMSLTVSELDEAENAGVVDGNLSAMFDSSLQITDKRVSGTSVGSSLNTNSLDSRRKSTEEASKAGLLDMSVATIGNDMSATGGFGSAFGSALGGDIEDSNAHMSFSGMFDESERNV